MPDNRKYRVGDLVRLSPTGVSYAMMSLRAFKFKGISYPIMLVNPDKVYKRASQWAWVITSLPEGYRANPMGWFAYTVKPYHLKPRGGLFSSSIMAQLTLESPHLPRHPVRIPFSFYCNGVNEDHIVKFLGQSRNISSNRRLTVKRNHGVTDA